MSYPTKKLGEVVDVVMGQSPPSSSYNECGEGLPFFQGKAEFGEIYPTPVKYCSSPSRIAEANDVLMSVRAPVGNINLAKEKSCVGRGLGALRAKKNIMNQMFLFYFMKKNENNWSKLSTGSTFSAIKGSNLRNFEIPVPPLAIQKQIVERLDKIAEAQKLNDGLIQKTDELFQSLLHKELNPAGRDWEENKFINCIEKNPLKIKGIPREKYQSVGKFPIIDQSDKFIVGYIDNEDAVYKIDSPVIIFGDHTRIFKYVDFNFAIGADGTQIIIPNAKFFPKFFYFLMLNLKINNLGYSRHFKLLKIKKLIIPPLKTQQQIVAKLSAVQDYKIKLLAQRTKLKELFESVLHKSMSGEYKKSKFTPSPNFGVGAQRPQ
ncbi:restriction endonuclease subunit S [Patescibacteria group bacterium]|nr:restriction endonuclease subunit S [Patescibacteria group bacterium]